MGTSVTQIRFTQFLIDVADPAACRFAILLALAPSRPSSGIRAETRKVLMYVDIDSHFDPVQICSNSHFRTDRRAPSVPYDAERGSCGTSTRR